jgi:hypothetical protein
MNKYVFRIIVRASAAVVMKNRFENISIAYRDIVSEEQSYTYTRIVL